MTLNPRCPWRTTYRARHSNIRTRDCLFCTKACANLAAHGQLRQEASEWLHAGNVMARVQFHVQTARERGKRISEASSRPTGGNVNSALGQARKSVASVTVKEQYENAFAASELLRCRNRAGESILSNDNLDYRGLIHVPLGLHHLQPALDRFFDVCQSFFAGLALREASRQRRNFRNVVTGFVLFYYYMKFHRLILPQLQRDVAVLLGRHCRVLVGENGASLNRAIFPKPAISIPFFQARRDSRTRPSRTSIFSRVW